MKDQRRQGVRLRCHGVVQGVGLRPALSRLADAHGLCGVLTNVAGAVQLDLVGRRESLQRFVERLPAALQPPAHLEQLQVEWLPMPLPAELATLSGLQIRAGARQPLDEGWWAPSLSADLAPCADCLAELRDPASRRYRYPFLSCSRCGPRYSIARAEPWCRAHTSLADFALCGACRSEFEDPGDRRFHAETIACPACGPRLMLSLAAAAETGFNACRDGDPLDRAVALLQEGGILALQGIGGFQLLVDAGNAAAVQRLRRRKRRPGKPLALLVTSADSLTPLVQLDAAERFWLEHPAAPIVLLRRLHSAPPLSGVAPGSDDLGVMLPASPLHALLAEAMGRPLVCTSGNRSGAALCIDPDVACDRLAGIADAVLHHDRAIARRLDDSLLQMVEGRPCLLRRARGFCPQALALPPGWSGAGQDDSSSLLALGGDLKAAPALAHGSRCWLAPHLGDLAEPLHHQRLQRGLEEQRQRADADGLRLVCDAHPGYLSQQLARSSQLPLKRVPHHLAHGLAVVAEHDLDPPLLLVAFDGLGYGEAPAAREQQPAGPLPHQHAVEPLPLLRGGEVLLLRSHAGHWRAEHAASLLPFPLPGAERAVLEPRRAALGVLHQAGLLNHPGAWRLERAFPEADQTLLLQALQAGCQAPLCSSAGRLFDAAASLLGLVQVLHYEGEAGLKLQAAAQRGLAAEPGVAAGGDLAAALPLRMPPAGGLPRLDWRPLLRGLLQRSVRGSDRHRAAAWFHLALAEGLAASLAELAARHRLGGNRPQIALSGGCFQNRLLLQATSQGLQRRGLTARWSEQVPCNDGGLALGQLLAVRQGLAVSVCS